MAPRNVQGEFYPLFMNKMFSEGLIEQNMFSIYITNIFDATQKDQDSKITIGGYNLEKFAQQGKEIHWVNLLSDSYWAIKLEKATLGKDKIKL